MTTWLPEVDRTEKRLYRAIARAIRRDLRSGRLSPGDRLPTHRELADDLGIAVGTVTRAYAEAERQGLVRGEIGRGTFVRGEEEEPLVPDLRIRSEPSGFVDLSLNYPLYTEDPDLAPVLEDLARRRDLPDLLHYHPSEGHRRHRRAGAKWAAGFGVECDPSSVVVCAGAQHGLTVSLGSIAEPGDLVLTEELTYPGIRGVADLLHLKLQGVALDDQGLRPDAFAAICRQRKVRALYVTPTLQNPTSTILPGDRRREIADIAKEHDVWIVEDDVHRLLANDAPPPLASLAPERTFFIAGTSKSITGGLRVAFLVPPPAKLGRVTQTVWATVWVVAPLCVEIVSTWIEDGTAEATVERKCREGEARQKMAREILGDFEYRSHPNGLYLWIQLPPPWTSAEFTMAARRRGVGVTPSGLFLVDDREPPDAVRICLGAPADRSRLGEALKTLADLLRSAPGLGPAIV